jgi:hypothetical protein
MNSMKGFALVTLLAASFVWGACGGSVVEAPEKGGAGGSAGSGAGSAGKAASGGTGFGGAGAGGASGTAGSGGGAPTCASLFADLQAKVAAARVCDPSMSSIQCSDSLLISDECGCKVAANIKTPQLAQAAVDAFEAYVAFGCPYGCGTPCASPGMGWYCGFSSSSTGICMPSYPD